MQVKHITIATSKANIDDCKQQPKKPTHMLQIYHHWVFNHLGQIYNSRPPKQSWPKTPSFCQNISIETSNHQVRTTKQCCETSHEVHPGWLWTSPNRLSTMWAPDRLYPHLRSVEVVQRWSDRTTHTKTTWWPWRRGHERGSSGWRLGFCVWETWMKKEISLMVSFICYNLKVKTFIFLLLIKIKISPFVIFKL